MEGGGVAQRDPATTRIRRRQRVEDGSGGGDGDGKGRKCGEGGFWPLSRLGIGTGSTDVLSSDVGSLSHVIPGPPVSDSTSQAVCQRIGCCRIFLDATWTHGR
uniref:Uncharacterized protein n=1 Tax=Arundo donax TaxID=35708 RepID=A0A0A9CEN4_ARUDO